MNLFPSYFSLKYFIKGAESLNLHGKYLYAMVFIKESNIYDIRKKIENSDNIIAFFFANAHNIYSFRLKVYKIDRKGNRRYPVEFHGRLLCLLCPNYRTK